jgi:hypothetical protein
MISKSRLLHEELSDECFQWIYMAGMAGGQGVPLAFFSISPASSKL